MQRTVSIDQWMTELPALIPGIDPTFLQFQLQATLRSFFTDSGCWMEKATARTLATGTTSYKVSPPASTDNLFVLGFYIVEDGENDRFVRVTPSDESGFILAGKDTFSVGSRYFQDGRVVQPYCAVKPCDPITKVPDFVRSVFYDGVLDGTLARLYQMQKKSWSNGSLAGHHGRRFRNAIAEARDYARKAYAMSETAWVFPSWA